MNFKQTTYASLLATLMLLSACGGGGSDGDDSVSPTPTPPSTPPPTPPSTPPPSPTPVDMDAQFQGYLTDLTAGHIVPRYQTLNQESMALRTRAQAFCGLTTPTESDLQALRAQWSTVNNAWQAIQWVKVGEVIADNKLFRIQFWPDNNDAVSRGVENLLIEPNTVNAETVASQNVGGQGIPALEYLLYPSNTSDSLLSASDRNKRCEVIEAISDNLVNITTSINDAWDPSGGNYGQALISGTGDFTSIQDSVEELVTNWLEHLEIIKDEKILSPLSTSAPGSIDIAEHWRSEASLTSIVANLHAFRSLYTNDEGQGFDSILSDALEQQAIAEQMIDAIDKAIADIEAIDSNFASYDQVLADEQGRIQLQQVIDDLRDIRDVLTTGFIQALNISIGFNSNDGD